MATNPIASDDGVLGILRALGAGRQTPIVTTFNSSVVSGSARYFDTSDAGAYLGVQQLLSGVDSASYFGVLRSGSTPGSLQPASLCPMTRFSLSGASNSTVTQDWGDLVSGVLSTAAADDNCLIYNSYASGNFGSTDFIPASTGSSAPTSLTAELTASGVPLLGVLVNICPSGTQVVATGDSRDGGPSGLLRVDFNAYSSHGLWVGWRGSIALGTDYLGTRSSATIFTSQKLDGVDLWQPALFRRPALYSSSLAALGSGFATTGSATSLTLGYESKQNANLTYVESTISGRVRLIFPHDYVIPYIMTQYTERDELVALLTNVLSQAGAKTSKPGWRPTPIGGATLAPGLKTLPRDSSWDALSADTRNEFMDAVAHDDVGDYTHDKFGELANQLAGYVVANRLLTPEAEGALFSLIKHPEMLDNRSVRDALVSWTGDMNRDSEPER